MAEENIVVELRFAAGQMRQPSLWGKVCQADGPILEYDAIPDQYDLEVEKTVRKITLQKFPEGSYLIMGVRGFHAAGALANCYALFQIKKDQHSEWQYPGHLAKFVGKNLLFLTQSETDLQPIYAKLTEMKFGSLDRLQNFLRKEKRDTSAPPAAK